MEKLFVIGNGFDLAHGLKTSYLNFKKFVYQQFCNSQVDIELDKLSEIRNIFLMILRFLPLLQVIMVRNCIMIERLQRNITS